MIINKVVRIGTVTIDTGEANVFCRIEFKDGMLSITGVEGPLSNGDAKGSCGQIVGSLKDNEDTITPAPGWSLDLIRQFLAVWDEWHLNDLTAGSPAQEAYLKAHPVEAVYPESHFDKVSKALEAAGINPDPNYLHKGKPYRYGSAWLSVSVPTEALEFLAALPDTDMQPAWV